ncbi:MAG: ribulose-phosphate 3-epimerase [Dehalococcoidaceae bacterium]|nr:ribulose-phosphate 3-epimerase [Dehalococcoidaceae bacterium]
MRSETLIVPAVLTDEPAKLASMVESSRQFTDWVQIDLMDGQFVSSVSVTPGDIEMLCPEIGWEAHIMAMHPEQMFEQINRAGAKRVIFHHEATTRHADVIRKAREFNLRVGVALNPETPVEAMKEYAPGIDCVLLMTVNPGYYGAPFIPGVLDKISRIRKRFPGVDIGIDGGIKPGNITLVARHGVDFICVGSAIFLSPEPARSYLELYQQVNSPQQGTS